MKIAVNAEDRRAALAFMDIGVDTIHRETFGKALELGLDALQLHGGLAWRIDISLNHRKE